MQQRYKMAVISLHLDSKVVDIKPTRGVLPGDSIAGDLFNQHVHEAYVLWSKDMEANSGNLHEPQSTITSVHNTSKGASSSSSQHVIVRHATYVPLSS